MTKYIIQRILAMLVTLFIIVTIGFMVLHSSLNWFSTGVPVNARRNF